MLHDGWPHVDLQELQAARNAAQVSPSAMYGFRSLLMLFVSATAGSWHVGLQQDRGIGW